MAAPLEPGIQYTLADLKYVVGSIALRLKNDFKAAGDLGVYLSAQPDADLISLGYTAGEVTIIKSVYNTELPPLKTTFDGLVQIKKVWGIGV